MQMEGQIKHNSPQTPTSPKPEIARLMMQMHQTITISAWELLYFWCFAKSAAAD
jgi:hypothetical protein